MLHKMPQDYGWGGGGGLVDSPRFAVTQPLFTQNPNQGWVNNILDGHGFSKEAMDENNSFIRSQLREASFARRILFPTVLEQGEYQRAVDHDLPVHLVDLEPDSRAYRMSYRGTPKSAWIVGRRVEMTFGMITSDVWRKHRVEMMAYPYDIKRVISDNLIKDMAAEEDATYYAGCHAIAEANPDQCVDVTSRLSRDGLISGIQALLAQKIPQGTMLCAAETWWDLARRPAVDVGDQFSERLMTQGVDAVDLFGIKCIRTIKRDIVPPNEVWLFGPEKFLGKSRLIYDATLYTKQEGPYFEMYAQTVIGTLIANDRSVIRIRFNRAVN